MTQIGLRWVRAIQLDPEIRSDWEAWITDRINTVSAPEQTEADAVKLRWIQGRLQEITYILDFIDKTMEAYRASGATDSVSSQNSADVAQK